MKLRILIAGLLIGVAAFAADSGAELFSKANIQEKAAGNLEEAIRLYQRVATEFASDHALAAKALMAEAKCYETLGQDKATKLYEQVVRDYRDQPDQAAAANARLAALRQGERAAATATMTQRKLDASHPPGSPGAFNLTFNNTDGRHAVYKDRVTGALMFADLASGESRVIFRPKAGGVDRFNVSRDMSMVFATLTADGKRTNAVIRTDGTGYREIAGDFTGHLEWSWDNRYVLGCENQPDGGARQPLRISVADGSVLNLREPERCIQTFSPDGRFIASAEGNGNGGQIFIGPSAGGDQQLVYDNAKLMGWTRDGRYLAIAISRSGAEALYVLPMKDGRRDGDPVFVRYGSFLTGQTTASGALVYESAPPDGLYATWLGTLDEDGRLAGWKPLNLSGSSKDPHAPTWSPDSSQIAYVSSSAAAGQSTQVVRVRNLASGEERELYRGESGEMFCVWAAKHPNLSCGQFTPDGATDVLSISTESGRAERLGSVPGKNYLLFGSPDDRMIYMGSTPGAELMRWEIASRKATLLLQGHGDVLGWITPSTDGRWIVRLEKGKTEIRPVSGGDWKPLTSGVSNQMTFTPDGNWLLYHGVDATGKDGLFRVATTGGQPEQLGDFPSTGRIGRMWISPDGKTIVADTSRPYDTWILENFEPKQQAAK
jgi:WD40 repeat protein